MNLEKLSLTVRDVATKKEKWQKTCWETKRKLGPFQVMTFLSVKICFSFSKKQQTTATCITLNEWLVDTNIYFTEVDKVFAFQILLTGRSHISADQIRKNYVLSVEHKEYRQKWCKWAKQTYPPQTERKITLERVR